MLKIGVQTARLLKRFGTDETFRLLKDCGFDFVDFSCNTLDDYLVGIHDKPDPLKGVFDLDWKDIEPMAAPYKAAADKYGVAFGQAHAPFPAYFKDNDYRNSYMRMVYEKCVMLCGYLGCPYLILHSASLGENGRRADNLDAEWAFNIDLYKSLIPLLREHHVTVCLENLFTARNGKLYGSICADFYEACDYIDELNDLAGEKRFAFCLDTGHALLCGDDIYTAIMKLGHRLETLHIHDNNGLSDEHLTPYMGVLDWNRFVMGLRDTGYQGGLSFETFRMLDVFPPEVTVEVMKLIASTGRLFAERIEKGNE